MKTYRILTITTVLVVAGMSAAQAQNAIMTFSVPFEFSIGDTSLSRDTYRVSRASVQSDVLLVRGSARDGMLIMGHTADSHPTGEDPQLVFHRYGQQNFLREIRFAGGFGVSLPETAEERDAAERRADRSPSRVETIIVRAQHQ